MTNNLAVRPEVVKSFTGELERIQDYQVYPMLTISDQLVHNGKYPRPDVKVGNGLFLDTAYLGWATTGVFPERKPSSVEFNVQPGHRLGREDSHNQVFFGRMMLRGMYQPDAEVEAHVAVKPTEKREALLGELAMLQYLGQIGVSTFKPIGLLVTPGDWPDHLITRFEKGVATMDTVEWRYLEDDEKWSQLEPAIGTLSQLHSNMLFHGDLEFKNVAFDETGKLIIVDPELMTSAAEAGLTALHSSDPVETERAIHLIKRKMSQDFSSVCKSIESLMMRYMPGEVKTMAELPKLKLLKKKLFEPYREALIESESQYLPVLLHAYDLMMHERKERARSA